MDDGTGREDVKTTLRQDFISDMIELGMELVGTSVKIAIAYYALLRIGHLRDGEAFATATLLGATDFFARRGRSRFVRDVRRKFLVKLPDGKIIEDESEETETYR